MKMIFLAKVNYKEKTNNANKHIKSTGEFAEG